MNGVGRLPKQVGEGNEGALSSLGGMKTSWLRYSSAAQRVSPPARIALVVLLGAQIMFLAIIRLGPTTSVWGGQGAESSKPIASLGRNSILLSGMSIKSQPFSDKEGKVSSEQSSPLPKKRADRKEKPTSEQKANPKKTSMEERARSEKEKTQSSPLPKKRAHRKKKPTSEQKATPKKTSMEKRVHSEKEKTSNVAHAEQHKVSDNSFHAKEQSVDGKFLTDTAMKESFITQSDSASDGSTLDTSVKKEDKQDVGSSVSGDTIHEETSFSSMRKAQTDTRAKPELDQNASNIKQVVIQGEAETGQEDEESDGSTFSNEEAQGNASEKQHQNVVVGEKLEEASIDTNVNLQAAKQEGQPVIAEDVIENAVSTSKVAKEGQGHSDPGKEQQSPSNEGAEVAAADASPESNVAEQGEQSVSTVEEASESSTPTEKERSAEELKAAPEEKRSKQGVVKDEVVLMEQKGHEEMSSLQCAYGYIYVYDLPPAFNRDVISNCSGLNPWHNVCPTLSNGGLGESLGTASPLGQEGSWYASDQFNAEIVFHNRILQHACLTDNMEIASAFYLPFYAGLDVGRYLHSGSSIESRDRLSNQFADWLVEQPAWKKSGGGVDHFMMVGRITWDFRRIREEDWGSGFFIKPTMQNITKLLIERNPWDNKEIGVPYPTNFHPQSDKDLIAWQNHIKGLKRNNLFSFAGAPRDKFLDDFRRILFKQCNEAEQCRSLDCSNGTCDDNQKTMEFFMDSTFCLQPRGDSFTRRSTFDCLLAGSIPVFFWRRSAYMQYEWHLPADEGSYSVFISKQDVRNGTKIEDVLRAIAPEKVRSMQEAVIQLIPKVVYAVSGFAITEKDAFDLAIEGVMRSLKGSKLS